MAQLTVIKSNSWYGKRASINPISFENRLRTRPVMCQRMCVHIIAIYVYIVTKNTGISDHQLPVYLLQYRNFVIREFLHLVIYIAV